MMIECWCHHLLLLVLLYYYSYYYHCYPCPTGKTYRLRVTGGIRFWIEGHDLTIISISGADVQPIVIPR